MNTLRQLRIKEYIEHKSVASIKELHALFPEVSLMTIHRDLDALERSGLSGVLIQRAITQAQNEYVLPRYPTSPEIKVVQHHAITFAICGLMSMMTRWHRSGYTESTQEMASIATALLTKPLIQI